MQDLLFARLYGRFMRRYHAWMEPRKRSMFAGVAGTVVELGPGPGPNLPLLPAGIRWIGIEPNGFMHGTLAARMREHGISGEIRGAGAAATGLPDGSVDVVISTLVLCTVPDPKAALREVLRILKPGGRFLFSEHVAAEPGSWLRLAQKLVRPFWILCGDGCRPDRDTLGAIREAGFASVEASGLRIPVPPAVRLVSPHVEGVAVRG